MTYVTENSDIEQSPLEAVHSMSSEEAKIADARAIIDKFDDTEETGTLADAFYQAFLHGYGQPISEPGDFKVLLPIYCATIPDKEVLQDKIRHFCKSKGKEVIEETFSSFKERGLISSDELGWLYYEGILVSFHYYEEDMSENRINVMTGGNMGNSYTFEKKDNAWSLISFGNWIS